MPDEESIAEYKNSGSPPRAHLNSIALVLGILLAMFSLAMLFYGLEGRVYVVQHDFIQHLGGVNVASDCYVAIMFLLIGAVCGAVSVRWLRGSRKER